MRATCGFSLKKMSCAVFVRSRLWKFPVQLRTIRIMWTCSLLLLCLVRASFSGSHLLCMVMIVSRILQSMEYLHSIRCRHLLHLYVLSSTSCRLAFCLYHMALMMSGLWYCDRYFSGRSRVGIVV